MRFPVMLCMSLILTASPAILAQHLHSAAPAPAPAAGAAAPAMNCEAMIQEMQASSKAMDDRLGQLVDDMNKAKDSEKVDRMAAVLNEMVTQRKQLREQMAAMMPKMMSHMSQHAQDGKMEGMAHSMEGCPMMKGKDTAPAPAEHKH